MLTRARLKSRGYKFKQLFPQVLEIRRGAGTPVVFVLFVLLIAICEPHSTLAATVTHLQSTAVSSSGSATSLSRAFTAANTAGSLIVAAVAFDSTGGTAWSCSDSQGNTYTSAVFRNDTRHNEAVGICYASNVKAGPNTVTATYGGVSHLWRSLAIHEYSGVAAASPLDKVSSNIGTSTAVSSLAVVPAQDGELIFGVVTIDDGSVPTITAGSGFSKRQSVTDATSEDQVQTTAASIAGTFTLNASHDYIAIVITFKPSGVAQLPPPDTTPPTVSLTAPAESTMVNKLGPSPSPRRRRTMSVSRVFNSSWTARVSALKSRPALTRLPGIRRRPRTDLMCCQRERGTERATPRFQPT